MKARYHLPADAYARLRMLSNFYAHHEGSRCGTNRGAAGENVSRASTSAAGVARSDSVYGQRGN